MNLLTRLSAMMVMLTFGLLVFTSCENTSTFQEESQAPDPELSIEEVKVFDGMFEFKDAEHFWDAVSHMPLMDEGEYNSWVNAQPFKTMLAKYNEFSELSASSYETGYNMSFDELRAIYGESVLIQDDGMFFLNSVNPYVAKLANEEGLVKVGKSIYKFMKDRYVVIEDGDRSKLEGAIRLDESSADLGILVSKVEPFSASREVCSSLGYVAPDIFGNFLTTTTIVFDNEWCFRLPASNPPNNCNYKLSAEIVNTQSVAEELLTIELRGFRRGAFGIWFGYDSRKTITSTTSSIFVTSDFNGQNVEFQNNLFGIGGNDNVLFQTVFNSNTTTLPAPGDIAPFSGYFAACVGFNIEFFHPFGLEFIPI